MCDSAEYYVSRNYPKLSVTSPEHAGYEPDQAVVDIDFATVEDNKVFTVYYQPQTVTYTVQHVRQDLNGDYPDANIEEAQQTGLVGHPAVVQYKDYSGFTPIISNQTSIIPTDDSLVLRQEYSRNSYIITFDTDGGSPYIPKQSYLFEAPVTAPKDTPSKANYKFAGWTPDLPASMPAKNLTVKATWTADDEATYTINYLAQNANDDNYTCFYRVQKTGKVGDKVTLPEISDMFKPGSVPRIDGNPIRLPDVQEDNLEYWNYFYSYNSTKSQGETEKTIALDGTTQVNLCFDRALFKLNFLSKVPNTHLVLHGVQQAFPYSFIARYGEDISRQFPGLDSVQGFPETIYINFWKQLKEDGRWLRWVEDYRTVDEWIAFKAYRPETIGNRQVGQVDFLVEPEINDGRRTNIRINYHFMNADAESDAFELSFNNTVKVEKYPVNGQDDDHFRIGWFPTDTFKGITSVRDDLAWTKSELYNTAFCNVPEFPGFSSFESTFYIKGDAAQDPDLYKDSATYGYTGILSTPVVRDGKQQIPPLNEGENWANGQADHYYIRNRYPLSLFVDNKTVTADEVLSILYEMPLKDAVQKYSPDRPANLDEGYQLKWYLDRGYNTALADEIMPLDGTQLYGRWEFTGEHTVTFDYNNATDTEPAKEETKQVLDGETVAEPAEKPVFAGHRFLGWELKTDKGLIGRYDFDSKVTRDITLQAQWEKINVGKVTIRYIKKSANGVEEKAHEDKVVENVLLSSDYAATAESVNGFLPDKRHKTVRVTGEENEIIFYYAPYSTAPYTVIYESLDQAGPDKFHEEVEYPDNKYNIVTEYPKDFAGFTPIKTRLDLILSQDPNENVLVFKYRKNGLSVYYIEYLFQQADGTYAPNDQLAPKMPLEAATGTNVTTQGHELAFSGYSLNTSKSVRQAVVDSTNQTTLVLYYDKLEQTVPSKPDTSSTEVKEILVRVKANNNNPSNTVLVPAPGSNNARPENKDLVVQLPRTGELGVSSSLPASLVLASSLLGFIRMKLAKKK